MCLSVDDVMVLWCTLPLIVILFFELTLSSFVVFVTFAFGPRRKNIENKFIRFYVHIQRLLSFFLLFASI